MPDLRAPDVPVMLEAEHYRAAVAVPVRSADNVIGVLSVLTFAVLVLKRREGRQSGLMLKMSWS